MAAILYLSKMINISCLKSYRAEIQNFSYLPPKYVIKFYFDNIWSMFSWELSSTEEGAEGPPEGSWGPPTLHRR